MSVAVRRVVSVALFAVMFLGPATAAHASLPGLADRATCEAAQPASFQGSWEQFDPPAEWLPPVFRPYLGNDTCAYRTIEQPSDPTAAPPIALFWVDWSFERYLQLLDSLQADGWVDPDDVLRVDTGSGRVPVSLSELRTTQPLPIASDGHLYVAGDADLQFTWIEEPNDVPLTVDWRRGGLVMSLVTERFFPAEGIDDPSVLSNLKTIGEAGLSGTQAVVLGGSAVMLMLVVGYPGSLLGTVAGSRYDQFAKWLRSRTTRDQKPGRKGWKPPAWLIWPGFAIAAIIGGFVDPAFGPNLMSLRVLASLFLAFLVFNLAVWTLVRLVITRLAPESKPYIKFRWGSLVIVLAAVVVARLLQFDPGVIFGLVAGVAFGMVLSASRDAIVILLGSGFALVAALVGWIGYSVLEPVAGTNPVLLFFSEFFSGVTIKGVSSLPLALLPLAGLTGAKLLKWKKWVWGIAYATGVAAFMFVLLNVPGSFGEIEGDFVRWISLFVAFAVLAVTLWAIDNYLSTKRKRRAEVVPKKVS